MWYMQVSVFIHNCACALAGTLILRFTAIIQLLCSIRYILAHNGQHLRMRILILYFSSIILRLAKPAFFRCMENLLWQRLYM